MKKRLLISALAITSIFALAQTTEEGSDNDTSSSTGRKFWGRDCHVRDLGGPNEMEVCCYHVFWIGFSCNQV